jgi:hypothetical protein
MNWRKRKIKISGDIEAGGEAVAFEKDIKTYFSEFIIEIESVFEIEKSKIHMFFKDAYLTADYEDSYLSKRDVNLNLTWCALPSFIQGLLELKTERVDEQSEGIFKILLKKPSDGKELAAKATYLYAEWRNYAAIQTEPVINEVIHAVNKSLVRFYEQVAEDYLKHLEVLIKQNGAIKSEVETGLSGEELKLQNDNNWFTELHERLLEIEKR